MNVIPNKDCWHSTYENFASDTRPLSWFFGWGLGTRLPSLPQPRPQALSLREPGNKSMAGHLPGCGFKSLPESLSFFSPCLYFLSWFLVFISCLYFSSSFLSLWLWLRLGSECQVWSTLKIWAFMRLAHLVTPHCPPNPPTGCHRTWWNLPGHPLCWSFLHAASKRS